MESALRQVSTVENYTRPNAKAGTSTLPRIMEAESSVRSEWAKLRQSDPGVSLSSIIDIVAQRHAIWPLIGDFTSAYQVKGGGGESKCHGRRHIGSRIISGKEICKIRICLRVGMYGGLTRAGGGGGGGPKTASYTAFRCEKGLSIFVDVVGLGLVFHMALESAQKKTTRRPAFQI